MNANQIQDAYSRWLRYYEPILADEKIGPFLNADIIGFSEGQSWLRQARNALFLSTDAVAQKLKVSRSAYAKFEKSEMKGAITMSSLAKAAEAMDCELVYAIRPKKKVKFSWLVWQPLLKASINQWWVVSRPEKRKSQALAATAHQKMNEPPFRRKQGWSQR